RISYDHAVEEALCFGWVDSIVKRIDDKKFAQKFTPRRDWTSWSAINIRRVRKLIREGRMTEAGRAKIDLASFGEDGDLRSGVSAGSGDPRREKTSKGDLEIPRFIKQALMTNAKAWDNFRNLAPSHRRAYLRWLMEAKKDQARERRLREAVSRLE